jgi:hypothetical protein
MVMKCKTHYRTGYQSVGLVARFQGRQRYFLVHRLVLLAFVGEPESRDTASHLNGIRTDNRLDNLCWESQAANCARKVEHGTNRRRKAA